MGRRNLFVCDATAFADSPVAQLPVGDLVAAGILAGQQGGRILVAVHLEGDTTIKENNNRTAISRKQLDSQIDKLQVERVPG